MSRSGAKQLVHSIVEFLRSELAQGEAALAAESAESVEVAVQCLETAYNLPASPAPTLNLYDLFSDAISSQQCSSRSAPSQEAGGGPSPAPTDEDKAQAEQYKMEGNTRMKEGNFAASIECYTKAIEKDPSNAVYYCNRAAAHSKTENHSAAIEDCKKALQLEPNYGKAYGRMGLAHSSLGELREACNCYKRAVELEPENESYASNLSIAEEKLASSSQQQPANPLAGLLSGGGGLAGLAGAFNSSGTPDLSGLLANPALMNVATQLMSDPNMQNMMTNILSGGVAGGGGAPAAAPASAPPPTSSSTSGTSSPQTGGGGFPDMTALLSAGRQLAEQMQSQHPELLSQLRSQMGDGQQPPNQQRPPQS